MVVDEESRSQLGKKDCLADCIRGPHDNGGRVNNEHAPVADQVNRARRNGLGSASRRVLV